MAIRNTSVQSHRSDIREASRSYNKPAEYAESAKLDQTCVMRADFARHGSKFYEVNCSQPLAVMKEGNK